MSAPSSDRLPWLGAGIGPTSAARHVADLVLTRPVTPLWLGGVALSGLLVGTLVVASIWLFMRGIGIWGVDIPVAWGFAIANFVWWIGIGHAGTLISAFLLLMRQRWRTAINRFAEAMTLFAVVCAGLFPLLHMGRPWFFYWLLPYPNHMGLWPQFRSPLIWDLFAVATYLTVSLLFWYVGLIPDLATLRDRARHRGVRLAFGVLAMGWRGSARHWQRYETGYKLLAGLATPLVVSVHSIVSFDFAVAIVPGWHTTIFPPYFVDGAVFSGFGMVLLLAIPMRRWFRLEGLITERHLDVMAKLLLATGLIVGYSYLTELFTDWYGGDPYARTEMLSRLFSSYAGLFWGALLCNVCAIQALWWRGVRRSPRALWAIALLAVLGMWLERVMIVVVGLHRDYLPSRWGDYMPTAWDWATLAGTIGLFTFLFILFARLLPVIAISETERLAWKSGERAHG